MTEKELTRLYTRYNKKYFDGKLPQEIPIKLIDMSKTENGGLHTGIDYHGLRLDNIYLDSTFKGYDALLKFFLLHEMAHAKLFPQPDGADPHGQQFDDEMMRLAFRGAFKGLW
jgi:predicted SprT family Zn-dependent metalloprotease